MRVLIVDDDITLRELLRMMLKNHEVYEADSGEKAIAMFTKFKPDVVLMDILMPGINGIETARKILEKDPTAVIIGISAFASNKGEEFIKVGAKTIIEKPFTRKKILEIVESYGKRGFS